MVDQIEKQDKIEKETENLILCEWHQKKCKVFKLNTDTEENIFCCKHCMMDKNYIHQQSVFLSDVCQYDSSSSSNIIESWPPLSNEDILKQVFNLRQMKLEQEKVSKQIVSFFDEFQNEIIDKVNEKKKKILIVSNENIERIGQLFKMYEQVASFDTLKSIIKDKQTTQKEKEKLLFNLIKQKKNDSQANTIELEKRFEEIKKGYFFNEVEHNKFKEQSIQFIDLIDSQNQASLQQVADLINSLSYPPNKREKEENKGDSNFDLIINLISNKSNNCNQKYLDSVKNELAKLNTAINKLLFNTEIYLPNKQQINIDFSEIDDASIKRFQSLITTFKEINQKQKVDSINKKSQLEAFYPTSNYILSLLFQNQEQISFIKPLIQSLFIKFPILESQKLFKQYNIESNGYIKNNRSQNQQSNTNYLPLPQNKLFKILIQVKNDNQIYHCYDYSIGLIQKYNSKKFEELFCFQFEQNKYNGISNVVKGQLKDLISYTSFEIFICIKDKLFQIQDYPNRKTVVKPDNDLLENIDLDQQFYLSLRENRSTLNIIDMQEINNSI